MITTEQLIKLKEVINEKMLPDHFTSYKDRNVKSKRYISKEKLNYLMDKLIKESKKDDEVRRTNEE